MQGLDIEVSAHSDREAKLLLKLDLSSVPALQTQCVLYVCFCSFVSACSRAVHLQLCLCRLLFMLSAFISNSCVFFSSFHAWPELWAFLCLQKKKKAVVSVMEHQPDIHLYLPLPKASFTLRERELLLAIFQEYGYVAILEK